MLEGSDEFDFDLLLTERGLFENRPVPRRRLPGAGLLNQVCEVGLAGRTWVMYF